jgi:hypothetical protein
MPLFRIIVMDKQLSPGGRSLDHHVAETFTEPLTVTCGVVGGGLTV